MHSDPRGAFTRIEGILSENMMFSRNTRKYSGSAAG
jgi:hypothetical protein